MSKLLPLGDRLFVRPDEEAKEKKTEGGVIILSEKKAEAYGTVVAVGPNVSVSVVPGDRVFFAAGSGTRIKQGNTELLCLHDSQLWGIVEPESPLPAPAL